MIGLVWKKTHKKELHAISVAVRDLYLRSINFAKTVLELSRLYDAKQITRKKLSKELFGLCNDFINKLEASNDKR